MKVVLLDDDTDRAQGWAAHLRNQHNVDAVAPDKEVVRQVISSLYNRRKVGRADGGNIWEIPCDLLDEAELLIIDYDLQNLEKTGEWTTGSEVAYAARLTSKAKSIIIVNQRGTNRFDLTMVKGVESRADLDIGSTQLTNPGLWQSEKFDGYRPWHWPNLHREPERVLKSIEYVKAHLDAPILATLGFSEDYDSGKSMRPEIWGRLCNSKTTSFRDLVAPVDTDSVVHVLPADIEIFKSDEYLIAAISASIVRRWLERWVLPNQDVLMDIPHLVSRFPWLLRNYEDEANWHSLESLNPAELLIGGANDYMFECEFFLSRPVYWAGTLEIKTDDFRDSKFDYTKVPDLVFREDVSNFASPDISRDFPSQVVSIENRRWISDPAEEKHFNGPQDIKAVVFEPQSLLLV